MQIMGGAFIKKLLTFYICKVFIFNLLYIIQNRNTQNSMLDSNIMLIYFIETRLSLSKSVIRLSLLYFTS